MKGTRCLYEGTSRAPERSKESSAGEGKRWDVI